MATQFRILLFAFALTLSACSQFWPIYELDIRAKGAYDLSCQKILRTCGTNWDPALQIATPGECSNKVFAEFHQTLKGPFHRRFEWSSIDCSITPKGKGRIRAKLSRMQDPGPNNLVDSGETRGTGMPIFLSNNAPTPSPQQAQP